jgi:Protein of unknown function (DUF732)
MTDEAHTTASDDGALAETVAKGPLAIAAIAADAEAWSDAIDIDTMPPGRHQRLVWAGLGLLVAATVAVVASLSAVLIGRSHHQAPTTASAATSSAPKPAPATTNAAYRRCHRYQPLELYTDADAAFGSAIRRDGVPFADTAEWKAIITAHTICEDLRQTHRPVTDEKQLLFTSRGQGEGWTYEQSAALVADAVNAYCPQAAS